MLLNTETSSKSIKPQTGVRQYLLIGDIKGNKLEETKIKIYNIQINRWRTSTVSDLFISYTLVINEFKSFNRIKIFIKILKIHTATDLLSIDFIFKKNTPLLVALHRGYHRETRTIHMNCTLSHLIIYF